MKEVKKKDTNKKLIRKHDKRIDLLKYVSKLYYPIQYIVIRCIVFGFVGELGIIDLWRGFRIGEIVKTALTVWESLQAMYHAGHWTLIIIFAIWYLLRLLWSCKFIVLYAFGAMQLLVFLGATARASRDRRKPNLNVQVTVRNGAPGDGKSRFTAFYVVVLSRLMWQKLSYIYWRDKSRVKKWIERGNTEKLEDWREVEDSYKYYTTPQSIDGKQVYPVPCLFSNIGMRVGDRYASRLTKAHATQEARLPAYTISFFDEWGTMFDVEDSKNKPLEISDDFRFCRQWRENVIFGTEQDSNNAFIDVRRVVTENQYMQGCKAYLKPVLLLVIFKPLQAIFARIQIGSKLFSPFMRGLEKTINAIGFVKFKYRNEGSTEHRQGRVERDNTFVITAWQDFQYDTRAFRKLYKLRNADILGEVHTRLAVDDTEQNRIDFLRAEQPPVVMNEYEELCESDYSIYQALKEEEGFYKTEELCKKVEKLRKDYPDIYNRYKHVQKPSKEK